MSQSQVSHQGFPSKIENQPMITKNRDYVCNTIVKLTNIFASNNLNRNYYSFVFLQYFIIFDI